MHTLVGLMFIGLIIWFWLDSARAREIATAVCQEACHSRGLQFLDQTVSLFRIGLSWTHRGVRLRRVFRFDFSEEGVGRRSGHLTLVGIDLVEFSMGLPGNGKAELPPAERPHNGGGS